MFQHFNYLTNLLWVYCSNFRNSKNGFKISSHSYIQKCIIPYQGFSSRRRAVSVYGRRQSMSADRVRGDCARKQSTGRVTFSSLVPGVRYPIFLGHLLTVCIFVSMQFTFTLFDFTDVLLRLTHTHKQKKKQKNQKPEYVRESRWEHWKSNE